MKVDEKDLKILELLKNNSKLSSYQIAKKTLIPVTTVHNRIKKLEKNEIIKAYTIKINEKKLGKMITSYVFLEFDINSMLSKKFTYDDIAREIKKAGIVEDLAYITGEKDIIIKIRTKDIEEANKYILEHLRKIPGILRTNTYVALQEF